MSYLKERVSYLKGLAEGLQISDTTNEGKLIKALIDVMDDFAIAVDDLEELHDQMSEQLDSIDEGLAEVERAVFDDEEDEDEEDEEDGFIEIECPHCHEDIHISADMMDEEKNTVECPNCHETIELHWECDCEEHKHE
ncbi:MAG: CPXCG motif-containing cysteine-rich protein [Clostridiales bacterium]|jgi:predicted Zn finger-like uncharacterized protein|nr:CPXCG motif-containing cysteine-rich protein [Eubacteriales bacterium]MDH7565244.1 CPXCG motif-containing cysteine-rich protein [Clostridiales bacterium]